MTKAKQLYSANPSLIIAAGLVIGAIILAFVFTVSTLALVAFVGGFLLPQSTNERAKTVTKTVNVAVKWVKAKFVGASNEANSIIKARKGSGAGGGGIGKEFKTDEKSQERKVTELA